MPWGVAAAAVGAAGSLAGGAMQSGAAGKAAKQAQHNLELALPQIQENYVTSVRGYQPYLAEGQKGLGATSDLLGLNGPDAAAAAMQNFQTSPGYQWQLDQGLRAVDAAAAAKGMGRSGAVLKAEQRYGQGLADQDFTDYYNRLFGLSGQGMTAAGGISTAANNLSAALENNAQSAAGINLAEGGAQSSIYGNIGSGLNNSVNALFNNKGFQNWAGGLFGGGSSPGVTQQGFGSGGIFY
jgi:hypothetical protein